MDSSSRSFLARYRRRVPGRAPAPYRSCVSENDVLGARPRSTRARRDFFARDPDLVAEELVGARLTVRDGSALTRVLIVETEAYGGADDPASHAFRGPTPRCAVMFGPAGRLYVYRIYGLHWCMNVVTGSEGEASAVLLRGAEVVATSPHARHDLPGPHATYLRGPGVLTRALGVTGEDDGASCTDLASRFSFHLAPTSPGPIDRTPRVGLTHGRERASRYALRGHPAVGRHPRYH